MIQLSQSRRPSAIQVLEKIKSIQCNTQNNKIAILSIEQKENNNQNPSVIVSKTSVQNQPIDWTKKIALISKN